MIIQQCGEDGREAAGAQIVWIARECGIAVGPVRAVEGGLCHTMTVRQNGRTP